MAEVYRARDLARQRAVAVKVLASHLADDISYAAQFRDEARRVARLNHPHVVPLYDVGEASIGERRALYFVMPLLRLSLRQRLRREGALPYSEAIRLTLEAAAGLQAAHVAGLIHCDVKPGNILLDADGHALLCDFGVARDTTGVMPGTFVAAPGAAFPENGEWVAGTPAYMAPEQLCGSVVDQRADVYSLGVVLYQLLTGQRPFEGATPLEIATHALHDAIIPPSVIAQRGDMPRGLDPLLLTALARDPRDRFSTMAGFAVAIRRLRADPEGFWDTPSVWAIPNTWGQEPGANSSGYLPAGRIQQPGGGHISRAKRLLCVAALAASLACAAGITTLSQSWGLAGRPGAGAGMAFIAPGVEARVKAITSSHLITVRTPTPTPTPTPTSTPAPPTTTSAQSNDGADAAKPHKPHGHGNGHGNGHGHGHGHGSQQVGDAQPVQNDNAAKQGHPAKPAPGKHKQTGKGAK
jgi:serine/threonine protein kinase